MDAKSQKLIRAKALITTAFATSILTSSMPAIADNTPPTKAPSALQHILADKTGTPFTKAFLFLQLADAYLTCGSTMAEKCFATENPVGGWERATQGMDYGIGAWSNQLSHQTQSDTTSTHQLTTANQTSFDDALEEALKVIEVIPNQFEKLRLTYIASLLYKKVGETKQYEKLNAILREAFSACEHSPNIDQEQIQGAVAVLNSMSYGVVPVVVVDISISPTEANHYKAQELQAPLEKAEALLLRALAIADRLPASSDVRKKAHRDMAIWYKRIGKKVSR